MSLLLITEYGNPVWSGIRFDADDNNDDHNAANDKREIVSERD